MGIEDEVQRLLQEHAMLDAPVDPDEALLGATLDSLGLLTLVSFLEDEYEIEIDDEEVTRAHFRTVTAISTFVTRKVAAATR